MGIFAISGLYGAGSADFARKLSQCLNYRLVDRDVVDKSMQSSDEHVFASGSSEDEAPSFLERFAELMNNKSFYRIALAAAIYRLALQDNAVFLGRGAHLILEGLPSVVSVHVVRKLQDRVKAVAQVKKISYEDALPLIEKKDKEKKEFVRYYFDRDLTDMTQFHCVMNAGAVSVNDAVEMICAYGKKHDTPENIGQTGVLLRNRLLESKADMLLFSLGIARTSKVDFEVREPGVLLVKGVVGGEHEKKRLLSALEGFKDIKRIEDHLKVGVLSHIIY